MVSNPTLKRKGKRQGKKEIKREKEQNILTSKRPLKLYKQIANINTGVKRITDIQKWAIKRSILMFLAAHTPMKQSTNRQNPRRIKNSQFK